MDGFQLGTGLATPFRPGGLDWSRSWPTAPSQDGGVHVDGGAGKPMEKRDVGVERYRIPAVWRGEEESLGDPQELSEKRTLPFTVSYARSPRWRMQRRTAGRRTEGNLPTSVRRSNEGGDLEVRCILDAGRRDPLGMWVPPLEEVRVRRRLIGCDSHIENRGLARRRHHVHEGVVELPPTRNVESSDDASPSMLAVRVINGGLVPGSDCGTVTSDCLTAVSQSACAGGS